MATSFGAVSTAAASSSFYWYGENGDTCWQTGHPGASSSSCDSVGENYLGSHTIEGAANANVLLTSGSGDYCNYYNTGDHLTWRDPTNEGEWTGFSPTPYEDYQLSGPEGNTCQAKGTTWGQELRGQPNDDCQGTYVPCGMQHYVSFYSQEDGLGDRPWSRAFHEPSLLISSEADPHSVTLVGGGAWGYICPLLEERSSKDVLELCLEQWRDEIGWGPAIKHFDEVAGCGGLSGHSFQIAITDFEPGTSFATESPGSANTFVFENNYASRTFSASITKGNLENAVNADNAECHEGFSTNPSEWSLIGVEQGVEGGALSLLAGHTANLQVSTTYNGYNPPEASTSAASGVQEEQTTLNGTIIPNGLDTHYYFEYGETTTYNSTVTPSSNDAGSGETPVSATPATITGLQPGMAYHYRIVASNEAGTTYGSDQTVTTRSAPSMIIDQGNDRWASEEGPGSTLDVYEAEQSTGRWTGPLQIGGSGTTYSGPSMIIDQGNDRWIAAEGANHTLDVYEAEQSTGKWAGPLQIGGSGTTYSAPSLIIDKGNDRWIAVEGAKHTLDVYEAEQSTGKWAGPLQIGTENSTYSAPSLIIDQGNDRWIAAEGPSNSLDVYEAEQSTGKWAGPIQPGGSGTTYSAPSLIIDQGNDRWIAAEGPNHALDVYEAEQSTGKWAGPIQPGGSGTTYSAPSLIIDQGNDRWASAEGASSSLDVYEAEQLTGKWFGPDAPELARTTAASGITEELATLNGLVDAKGTSTKYYFQYGETTSYGSSTPESSAGSGEGLGSVTPATITELQPGMTYHYRLVTTGTFGTIYGEDQMFTTSAPPSLIIDKGDDRWVAVEGAKNSLDVYEAEQSTGKWAGPLQVGGSGTTYSAPSLIIDQGNDRWIAAEGANHTLDVYEAEQSTGKWTGPLQVGGSGTTYSAPSMIIDKGDDRWIAAEGANHTLDVYEAEQSTGKWAGPIQPGGSGTTYSAPSLIIDQGNNRWVSAEGAKHTLDVYEAEQSTGKWAGPLQVGNENSTFSAPSLIIDQGNDRWIAAEGPSNSLDVYEAEQSTGKWAGPLGIGGEGTSW